MVSAGGPELTNPWCGRTRSCSFLKMFLVRKVSADAQAGATRTFTRRSALLDSYTEAQHAVRISRGLRARYIEDRCSGGKWSKSDR